jgi:hypothetical protein
MHIRGQSHVQFAGNQVNCTSGFDMSSTQVTQK